MPDPVPDPVPEPGAGTPGPPKDAGEGSFAAEIAAAGTGRWRVVILPLLAVFTALVIGALLIVVTNKVAMHDWNTFLQHPGRAFSTTWRTVRDTTTPSFSGALGSPSQIASAFGSGHLKDIREAFYPLSETIVTATPLIFVGLSVALGFRAGLFNIGAEGQMNIGAIAGAAVGIWWPGLPGPIHLVLMILPVSGGALWGASGDPEGEDRGA